MAKLVKRCPCLRPPNKEVRTLDFRHCNLCDIPSDIFMHERTLEELYVDTNQIRDLPKELFYCHGLRRLSLSDNEIAVIPPAIGSLINLEELHINKNGIIDLPDNIKCCKYLRLVEASINPLGRIPDGFTQLLNLTELYLNDAFLDFLPGNFGRLCKLKILELRENNLKTLPKSLSRLTQLERLDIGHNQFDELPDSIGNMVGLLELWCDHNKIQRIPAGIGNLKQLMFLDATKNKINCVPKEIGSCSSLADLYLTTNHIQSLPESLGCLSNLTTLKVDDNHLTSLPSTFGGLAALSELNASANDLEDLPSSIGFLRNLRTVYVDENFLTSVPPEIGSCTGITVLSLRGNRLSFMPDELGRIPQLRVLNLSDNRLKHLPFSIIKLKQLAALWLSESQTKPLIPFQTDTDPDTGRKVLTCYLLPQGPFTLADIQDRDDGDNNSFHPSLWEEQRREKSQIQFAFMDDDDDEESRLFRHPTPYPKEMKEHARHAKNLAMRQHLITSSPQKTDADRGEKDTTDHVPISRTPSSEICVREAPKTKPAPPVMREEKVRRSRASLHLNSSSEMKQKQRVRGRAEMDGFSSDREERHRTNREMETSRKGYDDGGFLKNKSQVRKSESQPTLESHAETTKINMERMLSYPAVSDAAVHKETEKNRPTVNQPENRPVIVTETKPSYTLIGIKYPGHRTEYTRPSSDVSQQRISSYSRHRDYDSDTGYRSEAGYRSDTGHRSETGYRSDIRSDTGYRSHRNVTGYNSDTGYRSDQCAYRTSSTNMPNWSYSHGRFVYKHGHRRETGYASDLGYQLNRPIHQRPPVPGSLPLPRSSHTAQSMPHDLNKINQNSRPYAPFQSHAVVSPYSRKASINSDEIYRPEKKTFSSAVPASTQFNYYPSDISHQVLPISGDTKLLGFPPNNISTNASTLPPPSPSNFRNGNFIGQSTPISPNVYSEIGENDSPSKTSTPRTHAPESYGDIPGLRRELYAGSLEQKTQVLPAEKTATSSLSGALQREVASVQAWPQHRTSTDTVCTSRTVPPPYPQTPPYKAPSFTQSHRQQHQPFATLEVNNNNFIDHDHCYEKFSAPKYSKIDDINRNVIYSHPPHPTSHKDPSVLPSKCDIISDNDGLPIDFLPVYSETSENLNNSCRPAIVCPNSVSQMRPSHCVEHVCSSQHVNPHLLPGGTYQQDPHPHHHDPHNHSHSSFDHFDPDLEDDVFRTDHSASQVSSSTDSGYSQGHPLCDRIGELCLRNTGTSSSSTTSSTPVLIHAQRCSREVTPTRHLDNVNNRVKDEFTADHLASQKPSVFSLTIAKNPGLGFSIAGGLSSFGNPFRPDDNGIFVTKVHTDGPASSRLMAADKLLQVNGIDFQTIQHEDAVNIMKNCKTVTLLVERR